MGSGGGIALKDNEVTDLGLGEEDGAQSNIPPGDGKNSYLCVETRCIS
jgi:hypothetical protein